MKRYLVHRLDRMSEDARDTLLDRMFPVLVRGTGAVLDPDTLRAYMLAPSERRRICEVRDADGQSVAFATFSLHFLHVDDEVIGVYRPAGFATCGVGFNPYMARLALRTWLTDQLRWPGRRFVAFGQIVQPLPYLFFRRYVPRMHPIDGRPTPPRLERLRDAAIVAFHQEVVRPPWVVRAYASYGRAPRVLGDEPVLAEFNRLNPHWKEGEALLFLLPMSPGNMAYGAGQLLSDLGRRWRRSALVRRRRARRRGLPRRTVE